jgi:hypothetical protein
MDYGMAVSIYNKKQDPVLYCAHSAYTQDTAQDLAMYLHACAGYPVLTRWTRAIANGNYRSWPHLSAAMGPKCIRRNLPKSIENTMGHMKVIRSGTRSTKTTKNKQTMGILISIRLHLVYQAQKQSFSNQSVSDHRPLLITV